MCTGVKNKRLKVAKEDITVYKLLFKTMNKTPYQFHEYEENVVEESPIKFEPRYSAWGLFDSVETGAWLDRIQTGLDMKFVATRGFHSALTVERLKYIIQESVGSEYCICVFTIPKGAKYILGLTDLIVSNKIIFTGERLKY